MNHAPSVADYKVDSPLIIIGAPRSGTNMLRDVLTAIPGVGTWPCDEINYLWRRGNAHWPTDELPPAVLTQGGRRAIRSAFDRLARRHSLSHVVEKTCANSLRVPYVRALFPEARIVFLVRDGRDAIASTMECWTRSPRLSYLLKKVRYVPPTDLPHYAAKFLRSQTHRFRSQENRWASWGPRFAGMDKLLREKPLLDVCAAQWAACVNHATDALADLGPERCYRLRYEDFVNQPQQELARLVKHFDIEAEADVFSQVTQRVSSRSIGKWRKTVNEQAMDEATCHLAPLLEQFGYGCPAGTSSAAA